MVHSTDTVCVDFDSFLAYFAQIGQKPTFLGFWYSILVINTQTWIDCVRYLKYFLDMLRIMNCSSPIYNEK